MGPAHRRLVCALAPLLALAISIPACKDRRRPSPKEVRAYAGGFLPKAAVAEGYYVNCDVDSIIFRYHRPSVHVADELLFLDRKLRQLGYRPNGKLGGFWQYERASKPAAAYGLEIVWAAPVREWLLVAYGQVDTQNEPANGFASLSGGEAERMRRVLWPMLGECRQSLKATAR